jgi:hypothetical protein
MEDPGITRLNIDHYRRLLKMTLDDATREATLALLAEAEARLSARATRAPWEPVTPG